MELFKRLKIIENKKKQGHNLSKGDLHTTVSYS